MGKRLKIHTAFLTGLMLCVTLVFLSCDDSITEPTGSENNPIPISTFDQLQAIADPENLDKHFIQVKNIDASASKEFSVSMHGFIPIGTREAPFTGSYDGNGYQITDLTYHRFHKFRGLFGYILGAEIKNVTLVQTDQGEAEKMVMGLATQNDEPVFHSLTIDVDSDNFQVGGALVAFNDGGVIDNCHSNSFFGSIKHNTGGLVGFNGGDILNSSATKDVGGHSMSGGLAAYNSGLIKNSYATGRASSLGSAGGLVGYNYGGQIINSYSERTGSSQLYNGGLAALNTGLIKASYAIANTSSSDYGFAGGLVGQNDGEIRDSYSLGSVNYRKHTEAGSLTGNNLENGVIINSFATGHVSGYPEEVDALTGGITANNEGTLTAVYWNIETTGQNGGVGTGNPNEATSLTTDQMTGPAAEINMPEFDWSTVWRTTDGYPELRWQQE